jgi:hypothetical protein
MAPPLFIHVQTNGDIYVSNQLVDNAPGTLAGTFRVNPNACLTKITTITGSNPYAVTGSTGKLGSELGTRK